MAERSAKRIGPRREGEEPSPPMNGPEKSDLAIVARKPANVPADAATERAERRAGAEGNVGQARTVQAQTRAAVVPRLDRVREVARAATRHDPRWEPDALVGLVRFCAGRAQ